MWMRGASGAAAGTRAAADAKAKSLKDLSAWDPYAAAKAEARARKAGLQTTSFQRRAARNLVTFDEEGCLATVVARVEAPY